MNKIKHLFFSLSACCVFPSWPSQILLCKTHHLWPDALIFCVSNTLLDHTCLVALHGALWEQDQEQGGWTRNDFSPETQSNLPCGKLLANNSSNHFWQKEEMHCFWHIDLLLLCQTCKVSFWPQLELGLTMSCGFSSSFSKIEQNKLGASTLQKWTSFLLTDWANMLPCQSQKQWKNAWRPESWMNIIVWCSWNIMQGCLNLTVFS